MNNYLYWIRTDSREQVLDNPICQYYEDMLLELLELLELDFTGDTLILTYE